MALPKIDFDFRTFAILLDVDGTLLDIAPTPDGVHASSTLRDTLAGLHDRTGGALALVSGRPIFDLDRIFEPVRLPAIGGHGAEIRPSGDPESARKLAGQVDRRVREEVRALAGDGVLVEDKGYSLAVHFRNAPEREPELRKTLAALVAKAAAPVELLAGKAVLELKPTRFNKGNGVRRLMELAPFAGRRPLFIGDDVTDEAAFAVLPEYDGIGISVGRRFDGASHVFDTPHHVRQWLLRLLETEQAAAS